MATHNIFSALTVGINALSLSRLLKDAEGKADAAQALALYDQGVRYWPSIAAANGGIITLHTRSSTEGDDRTYTTKPFPLQSLSKHLGLRAAFTSPYEGEVLVYADWRASHWQLLAFYSGDAQLQADLRSGDLYNNLFPGRERKSVKAGLATLLNGGGMTALKKVFAEAEAQQFLADATRLLETRWATANAYRLQLRDEALANGWADADKAYSGAGVALMRIEAKALRTAVEEVLSAGLGVRVVLPMHDGVLVSAPADKADAVAECLGYCMARASTLSEQEAANHADVWVDVQVQDSWGGQEPQLLGNQLRAVALSCVQADDADRLAVAAAVMPGALQARLQSVAPASAEARAIKHALHQKKEAADWLRAATASSEAPLVDLSRPVANYSNLCRLLREDQLLPRLRFNLRTLSAEIDGARLDDNAIGPKFVEPIENRYGFSAIPFEIIGRAMMDVARENGYDPIKDYYDGLTWDGVKRLDTWMTDHTGAIAGASSEPERLANIYGRKWFLSVVARAYQPGCKVDSVLVLQGEQNIGKSTLFKVIAPRNSFAAITIDPADKDIVRRASAYAVVEWPEAAGMSKREQEALKQYFSEQVDRLRLPYGKADIEIPRRVVFGMTANNNNFLRDPTGSRRYWPVTVEGVDLDGLRKVVDQLWAEAVAVYRADPEQDYLWWLSPEEEALREEGAIAYTEEDPYADAVIAVMTRNRGELQLSEVMDYLDIPQDRRVKMQKELAATCRKLGFINKLKRKPGYKNGVHLWLAPSPIAETEPKFYP